MKKSNIAIILSCAIIGGLIGLIVGYKYIYLQKKNNPTFSIYYTGNYKNIYRKLLTAAKDGDAVAQASLGNLYRNGLGVEQNYQKAYYWYKKAADQNNSSAIGNIGLMYKNGIYLKQSDTKAVEYYKKAILANNSNSTTKYNLALIYLNSISGQKNIDKGLRLLKEASDENNSTAQSQLGISYYLGLYGLNINYNNAYGLLIKSANQGDPIGQNNLALLYYEGSAVKKDDYKAYFWFYIASKYGNYAKSKKHY